MSFPQAFLATLQGTKPMKIGLIGTFDVENFGDCMFPELYQHLLSQKIPDAQFHLYSPTDNCALILSFDKVDTLPTHLDETQTFDEDALILIGGETIGMGHSAGTFNFPRQTLSAYMRLWVMPILSFLDTEARPKFFGAHCVGAIKMRSEVNEKVAQVLNGASHCAFRDEFSASWIRSGDIGFSKKVDPMFLIDHLRSEDEWSQLTKKHLPDVYIKTGYLSVQMTMGYGGDDLDGWCDAVATISKTVGLPVALVPICHFLQDEAFLDIARVRLEQRGIECTLIRGLINVKDTAALIGGSAGYIGSSLHGAVTAVAFAKPIAVLGHSMDGKHEGCLKAVGISGAVTTTPEGLAKCFETTAASDLKVTRARAQDAARKSFDTLLLALVTMREIDPAVVKDAQKRAAELSASETAAMPVMSKMEIKRRLLRGLHRFPALSKRYHALRIRQKVGRATHS
ncbi:polysaccharide pyruvyl transferase family protein [Yoonia sp.]|uniref:polysaccharide pyruvyl transferase family protein n=1 Tax=Yoonia sp. TaxID=2212373 RepID=UPI00289E0AFA|nr:polysaccharide pyruvyl transferase family protein [Yoonia sp.]